MISYSCECGLSHVSDGYTLDEVTCDYCGKVGAEGKTEITKDSDLNMSDIAWAWKYIKEEPMNVDGTTKNAFFGFEKGTKFIDIADWFVQTLMDFDELYGDEEEEEE